MLISDKVMDLEKNRLFWIIQVGPKCNHKGPFKRCRTIPVWWIMPAIIPETEARNSGF
jgi:hypothetical protein